jgi:hypothetical protein
VIDLLTEAAAQLAFRVVLALLHDLLIVGAVVAAVAAVAHVPTLHRVPLLGLVLADLDRGARRLFVRPAERLLRHGTTPRHLSLGLLVAVLAVAGIGIAATVVAVLVVCWLVGHVWHDRTAGWWSHRTLTGALTSAGILRAPRPDEPPLSLSYRGAPRHTDAGTTVVVGLPQARTVADVLARREALAAALRVPTAALSVSQEETDPAGVVRLQVAHGSRSPRGDDVTTDTETDEWAETPPDWRPRTPARWRTRAAATIGAAVLIGASAAGGYAYAADRTQPKPEVVPVSVERCAATVEDAVEDQLDEWTTP